MVESILILTLCVNNIRYNKYPSLQIILMYVFVVVLYNYGCGCFNLSIYYQTINFLNSKSNIIIVVTFFFLLYLNKKKSTNNTSMVLIFFFFITFFSSFELNQCCLFLLNNKAKINTNLMNGIMLVHPYILYFFYAAFINSVLFIPHNLFFLLHRKDRVLKKKNKIDAIKNFLVVYLSIILGSLWAEQELSWGGWWSWDFVELLALNYLIFILYLVHCNKNKLNKFDLYFYSGVLFFMAILSVRFNIINSIHNFISIESQNQYYYYVLLFILLSLLYALFFVLMFAIKDGFNTTFVFFSLMFILYYLFVHNVFLINLIKIIQTVQPNTKYIYTSLLLVFLVLFFLNQPKGIGFLFYFIFYLNFSFITVLLLTVFIYLFLQRNFKKKPILNLIHMSSFLFILLTQQQLYIFYSDILFNNTDFIQTLKTTNNILVSKSYTSEVGNLSNLCLNTYINYDLYLCSFDFSTGLNKNIFEKSIVLGSNVLIESYSYNSQKLIQPLGQGIILILLLILFLLLPLVTKKIKLLI